VASNFKGIKLLTGRRTSCCPAMDDVWVAPDGELFVADYKGTASASTSR